jgi:cytochrome c biogenesis protein CcmG, thiol:disulfide interchange protein DsbE
MTARRAVIAVVALIVAAGAAAVFIGNPSSPSAPAVADKTAPTFRLAALREGQPEVALRAMPGTPTVVNFFAAWCAPCKRELPALRDAAAANAGRVAFVGVDHQDSRDDAIEMLDEAGVAYPAGYDPKGDVAARYGVRGLPATAFVTADGRLLELHQGELTGTALADGIRRLTLQSTNS